MHQFALLTRLPELILQGKPGTAVVQPCTTAGTGLCSIFLREEEQN